MVCTYKLVLLKSSIFFFNTIFISGTCTKIYTSFSLLFLACECECEWGTPV